MPRQYKQIHFVLWKIYNIFSLKVVKLQPLAAAYCRIYVNFRPGEHQ